MMMKTSCSSHCSSISALFLGIIHLLSLPHPSIHQQSSPAPSSRLSRVPLLLGSHLSGAQIRHKSLAKLTTTTAPPPEPFVGRKKPSLAVYNNVAAVTNTNSEGWGNETGEELLANGQMLASVPDLSDPCFRRYANSIIVNAQPFERRSSISLINCKVQCLRSPVGIYACRSFVYDNLNQVCDLFAHVGDQSPAKLLRFKTRDYFEPTSAIHCAIDENGNRIAVPLPLSLTAPAAPMMPSLVPIMGTFNRAQQQPPNADGGGAAAVSSTAFPFLSISPTAVVPSLNVPSLNVPTTTTTTMLTSFQTRVPAATVGQTAAPAGAATAEGDEYDDEVEQLEHAPAPTGSSNNGPAKQQQHNGAGGDTNLKGGSGATTTGDHHQNHKQQQQHQTEECTASQVPRFLRTVDVELSGFDESRIGNVRGVEECATTCVNRRTAQSGTPPAKCHSFEFTAARSECTFSAELAVPLGNGQLRQTTGTDYFERICVDKLLANQCQPSLVPGFRRFPQMILVGFAETVVDAPSLQECFDNCLNSRQLYGFICSSGMFYFEEPQLNCILNTEDRTSQPELFTAETSDLVDYFETGCLGNRTPTIGAPRKQLDDRARSGHYSSRKKAKQHRESPMPKTMMASSSALSSSLPSSSLAASFVPSTPSRTAAASSSGAIWTGWSNCAGKNRWTTIGTQMRQKLCAGTRLCGTEERQCSLAKARTSTVPSRKGIDGTKLAGTPPIGESRRRDHQRPASMGHQNARTTIRFLWRRRR